MIRLYPRYCQDWVHELPQASAGNSQLTRSLLCEPQPISQALFQVFDHAKPLSQSLGRSRARERRCSFFNLVPSLGKAPWRRGWLVLLGDVIARKQIPAETEPQRLRARLCEPVFQGDFYKSNVYENMASIGKHFWP